MAMNGYQARENTFTVDIDDITAQQDQGQGQGLGYVPKRRTLFSSLSNTQSSDKSSIGPFDGPSRLLPPPYPAPTKQCSTIADTVRLSQQPHCSSSSSSSGSALNPYIHFAKAQEVELLWLETTKIFADVCVHEQQAVAKEALSGLQNLIKSGRTSGLPESVWSRVLQELLTRLPLGTIQIDYSPRNFTTATTTATAIASSAGSSVGNDFMGDFDTERCLVCCDVVFDLFVQNIVQIQVSTDFSAYWCKFTSILASNISVTDKGSRPYERLLEMIIVLFKLLKPIPPSVLSIQPVKIASAGTMKKISFSLLNVYEIENRRYLRGHSLIFFSFTSSNIFIHLNCSLYILPRHSLFSPTSTLAS